jgi:short-subunit dehydrogenase
VTSFTNQRIWVTGASAGIGAAVAQVFLRRGARVALTARRTDLLTAIAARHDASTVMVVPADVTDRIAVEAAARTIEERWGGIDLAVFNAGGVVEHDYVETMRLNYFSVVYGIQAVLPGMLARGTGHVAGVASLAGYRALPDAVPYGASKAAVIYLMDGLRFEVEPQGVAVTTINPGFIRTPLTDKNEFHMPFLVEVDDAAERIVRGLERRAREIHFPAPLSWTLKLLRILPYPLYERVMKTQRRSAPTPRS